MIGIATALGEIVGYPRVRFWPLTPQFLVTFRECGCIARHLEGAGGSRFGQVDL